jgi:hypothetical protein
MQRTVLALLLLVGLTSPASAAFVVGGTLLSGADANQLEAWLGQGSITLTNIFTKTPGDLKTSANFHVAADGQGPTFSLIRVASSPGVVTQLIGGYNPQSWSRYFNANGIDNYNVTLSDSLRTAFIFNLTTTEKQNQKLSSQPYSNGVDYGKYQSFNQTEYGPTFGFGNDIYTNQGLDGGFTRNLSYGTDYLTNNILSGTDSFTQNLSYSGVEVFLIRQSNIPEPGTLSLMLLGLVGLGSVGRKQLGCPR